MIPDAAVTVEDLSKVYKLYDSHKDRLKEALNPFRTQYRKDFYALRNVSFQITKGDTVGIIGRNGSGKSTLLKIISGVLTPTSGSVTVSGKVSALLELGAGFNPELTGLENVYFNGILMGYTRNEMNQKMDGILSFADIGDFIHQPVKTYSSGMFVRLAFAVAIKVEPEILVVDEALSVGDMAFQQKCLDHFRQLQQAGVTIILVTHDILLTRTCCRSVIYLADGAVKAMADPETAGEMYINDMRLVSTSIPLQQTTLERHADVGAHFGDRDGEIIAVALLVDGRSTTAVAEGDLLEIRVKARVGHDIAHPMLIVQIRDSRGYVLYGILTSESDLCVNKEIEIVQQFEAILRVPMILVPGRYGVTVGVVNSHGNATYDVLDKQVAAAIFTVVPAPAAKNSVCHGAVNLGGAWAHPGEKQS